MEGAGGHEQCDRVDRGHLEPVTGCDRVAAGCDNCYALALSKRLKAMGAEKYQNDGDPRTSGPGFGVTTHPGSLEQPFKWKSPKLVFVNSMSDLFHAKVPIAFVREIFDVIRETPQHTYQVLTKRAHRMARFADKLDWPDNLWMGVSVESFDAVDRIDHLRATPAAVRFLSCEPLITALPNLDLTDIDWVIAGGESGPNARAMDRVGYGHPRPVHQCRRRLLLQAVGRAHAEGQRPRARGSPMERDADSNYDLSAVPRRITCRAACWPWSRTRPPHP